MMKQASKFLLLFGITALMAGCKLAVIVVEGGEVQSEGSGTCAEGMICIVEVIDTNFTETFEAVSDTGWYFHKWNSGDRLFCGGSVDPICTLSFRGHEESEWVKDMVPSSEMYYLMPVFKEVSPFVEVNGKLWAQPGLFSEISWNDIEAVCPNPTGLCTGDLNGIDLNGWTWASVDDVTALFNYYIGSDVLGPAPVSYFEYDSEWAPAFFSDGWARTNMHESSRLKVVEGWLRSLHDDQNAYHAQILYITGPAFDTVDSRNADHIRIVEDEIAHIFDDRGGWFYRTP